jgi:hypothetical protein
MSEKGTKIRLENQDIDERMLKCMLKRQDWKMWTEFVWLSTSMEKEWGPVDTSVDLWVPQSAWTVSTEWPLAFKTETCSNSLVT